MFPALASGEPSLQPVLDRLEAEHLVIAEVLDRFDRALVDLVREDDADAGSAGRRASPRSASWPRTGRIAAARTWPMRRTSWPGVWR